MPSRITQKLNELRNTGRKAFAAYIMAGDPNLMATERLALAFEDAGVSILELGIPFSDPMADGPIIQRAAERALQNHVTLDDVLKLVERLRTNSQLPVLLMGYYNPILQYGLQKFAAEAARVGVDALLVVDLPVEEAVPLNTALREHGLDQIFLVTPTSTPERIRLVRQYGSGFVYYVSLTGVTGAATLDPAAVARQVSRLKKQVPLPVLVGFGISTAEHVTQIAHAADGVVVGSAILKTLEAAPANALIPTTTQMVHELVAALPGPSI